MRFVRNTDCFRRKNLDGVKHSMFVTASSEVNEKNHLTIGGVDTVSLVQKYGTPLYVMDEDMIRQNCRIYKEAIDRDYHGNGLILYASKAFSCLHMYLFLMPVLVVIHSSLVSTIRLKSSFVIISSGSAFPVDTI